MKQKPIRGSRLDITHRLSRGMILSYLFNEGTGEKVFDLSLNENHGTIYGATWKPMYLYFDGNDYVSLPKELIANINTYTIVAWFKSTDTGTGNIIYAETKSDSGTARVFLSCEGNSGFEFSHRDDSNNEASISTATQYNDGDWHYAVGIRKASNDWELVIDNVSIGTNSTSVGTTTVDRYEIGARRSTSNHFFAGGIDKSNIYNRALSATEIAWLDRENYAMFL